MRTELEQDFQAAAKYLRSAVAKTRTRQREEYLYTIYDAHSTLNPLPFPEFLQHCLVLIDLIVLKLFSTSSCHPKHRFSANHTANDRYAKNLSMHTKTERERASTFSSHTKLINQQATDSVIVGRWKPREYLYSWRKCDTETDRTSILTGMLGAYRRN